MSLAFVEFSLGFIELQQVFSNLVVVCGVPQSALGCHRCSWFRLPVNKNGWLSSFVDLLFFFRRTSGCRWVGCPATRNGADVSAGRGQWAARAFADQWGGNRCAELANHREWIRHRGVHGRASEKIGSTTPPSPTGLGLDNRMKTKKRKQSPIKSNDYDFDSPNSDSSPSRQLPLRLFTFIVEISCWSSRFIYYFYWNPSNMNKPLIRVLDSMDI